MIKRQPLKVVHLTSVHPAWDTRIAYRECATLADAGYDVVLVASGDASQPLPRGVRLHSVPKPRNRFERMTRTIWRVFRAALDERADVYHFHDPELMGVGLALRLRGAKVVFDVHEDIPQDIADKPWITPKLRMPIAIASSVFLNGMQRWYSAIVTATPAIARRFRHRRTIVIHNYPRLDELPSLRHHNDSASDPLAIYLGSITELRCVEEMIKGVALAGAACNVRLRLAGPFESDDLERRMRALPEWALVDYLGYLPRDQALRQLNCASVGLLLFRAAANHDECMPTKLFEYLGAGIPVIISNTMECSSIIRDNECGCVVDPTDIEAIARAITFFIQNPAIAQAMGRRGRRLVMERYQWTSEASKLTNLYAEIA